MYVDYDEDLLDIGLIEPELKWETVGICDNCMPKQSMDFEYKTKGGKLTIVPLLVPLAEEMRPCNPSHTFPKIVWKTTTGEIARGIGWRNPHIKRASYI